jgi:sulfofructose kinase
MNSDRKWDIIGFGAIAVDDLLFVSSFPQPNSKIEVNRRERHGGGLAGTALVAASRLGARAAYFGCLGENDLSRFTRQEFAKENVDTSLCIMSESAQPIYSAIIVDQSTGDRTILYSLENFAPPKPELIPAHLPDLCKLVFVDTYFLSIMDYIVDISHANGIPVIADIESLQIVDYQKSLDSIDFLILGMDIAGQITKEKIPTGILRQLNAGKRQCTVITDGANGCWYQECGNPMYHMPAFAVNAIDTTGCGDVFHGAFAAALVRGETIPSAVVLASAAAAMKATKSGGRAGIPSLPVVLDFIQSNSSVIPEMVI